jgi:hypothetical protein
MTSRSETKQSAQQKRLQDLLLEVSQHAHKEELLRYIAARGGSNLSNLGKLVAVASLLVWATQCSL